VTGCKFCDWRERYGRVFWLEDWEKQAIIGFHLKNPLEGYEEPFDKCRAGTQVRTWRISQSTN